ncbi:hypothetical protein T12_10348 [Trichinella patagoniensis]|uniref:Uncharacterized protein n=1 Tax=Trichinella patagoniensis TaxID=990121 RepID=A0A0V0Z0L0_9BILA|nr:hypothetical protein T12_10348 [Trichinella patagoniensis]
MKFYCENVGGVRGEIGTRPLIMKNHITVSIEVEPDNQIVRSLSSLRPKVNSIIVSKAEFLQNMAKSIATANNLQIMFDEFGHPFFLFKDQAKKKRLVGIEAIKKRTIAGVLSKFF